MCQYIVFCSENKEVENWKCTYCSQPDLKNSQIHMHHTFFVNYEQLDSETKERCNKKLNQWRLSQEPNFRWCLRVIQNFFLVI